MTPMKTDIHMHNAEAAVAATDWPCRRALGNEPLFGTANALVRRRMR